jgi:hypothetical protein
MFNLLETEEKIEKIQEKKPREKRSTSSESSKSKLKEEEISKIFETEDKRNKSIGYFSPNNNRTINVSEGGDEFDSLRKSVKAVTSQEMQGIF